MLNEMKRYLGFTLLIALGLLLVACNFATAFAPGSASGLPQTDADVPRISPAEALAAIESGDAIVVDTRNAEAYATSHIPGAVSIPVAEFEADPSSLPLDKAKWIITYCT